MQVLTSDNSSSFVVTLSFMPSTVVSFIFFTDLIY